ncbi:hypothetical protein ACOTEY_12640 [Achromobacter xylosoxidans]
MNTPAPKTSPDAALGNLMAAALDVPAAPEQPAVPDDTLARTGNTADHQAGWFAGMEQGQANAKANAAIRAQAQEYGSPAEVAQRIEQYIGRYGRENTATLLLYEAMNALRRPAPAAGDALDAARWRAYAKLFPEISASFLATHAVDGGDPLPTIKGASITGGYVVVTPAGWDADKAAKLRDAILRLLPVNPAHTPRPSDELAAQRKGDA